MEILFYHMDYLVENDIYVDSAEIAKSVFHFSSFKSSQSMVTTISGPSLESVKLPYLRRYLVGGFVVLHDPVLDTQLPLA